MSARRRMQRVRMLYEGAIHRDGSDRVRYLRRECGDDSSLLRDVETLLAYDDDDRAIDGPAREAQRLGGAHALTLGDALLAPEVDGHVGGYRIIRKIGEGGMGAVYEAEQESPRRRVALKILKPGRRGAEGLKRFELEGAILGRLQHPCIAQVYESGSVEVAGIALPFLAMELVRGTPIMDWVDRRALDLRSRLLLIAELCDAVQHAHTQGVIHRDLKPGNLMVDAEGRAKVLDFGVARAMDEPSETLHTRTGELVGTVRYMSPEQARGRPEDLDTRSDVYALGLVAYEILSNRPARDVDGLPLRDALEQVIDVSVAPLGSVVPSLRGDLETIVGKALERDKEQRYVTAAAMRADLLAFLDDEPIAARPPSAWYQLKKFARRNRVLVGGAVATLLAIVAGAAVSAFFAVRAAENERLATQQASRAERRSRKADRATYAALIRAAASAREAGRPDRAREHLRLADPALRGIEWRFIDAGLDDASHVFGAAHAVRGQVSWTDDGAALVHARADGVVVIRSGAELESVRRLTVGTDVTTAVPGPGGTFVAVGFGDGSVRVINVADGIVTGRVAPDGDVLDPVAQLDVNATGDRVAVRTAGGRVWLWVPSSGERIAVEGSHAGVAWHPFRPDVLAVSGAASIVDGTNGKVVVELHRDYERPSSVQWGREGSTLLLGTTHPGIYRFDVERRASVGYFRGRSRAFTSLALTPDGRGLVTGDSGGGVYIRDLVTGERTRSLSGHRRAVRGLAVNPRDGRIAAVAGNYIRLWDRDSRPRVIRLRGHESYVDGIGLSPDGSRLVSIAWDGTLRLWDVEKRCAIGILTDGLHGAFGAGFGIDGATVFASSHATHWIDLETGWERYPGRNLHQHLWALDPKSVPEHGFPATDVVRAPDGTSGLFVRGGRKRIEHLELETGRTIRTVKLPSDPLCVAFDRRKENVFVACADGLVRGFAWPAMEAGAVLEGHVGAVRALAFSADGSRLLTGGADGTIRFWGYPTLEEIWVFDAGGGDVRSLALSEDGRVLAAGSGDHEIRVWTSDTPWESRRRAARSRSGLPAGSSRVSRAFAVDVRRPPFADDRTVEVRVNGGVAGRAFGTRMAHVPSMRRVLVADPDAAIGGHRGGAVTAFDDRLRVVWQLRGSLSDGLGSGLLAIADVDGDGIEDVAIGAPGRASPRGDDAGAVLLVSGRDGRVLRTLAGQRPGDRFGKRLARVGDLDGDGVREFTATRAYGSGRAAVVVISPRGAEVLMDIPIASTFARRAPRVADAGDHDGDGVPDLLFGFPYDGAGVIELRRGRDGGLLWRHETDASSGWYGLGLVGMPDLDSDGIPEVMVSDSLAARGRGRIWVLSGASRAPLHVFEGLREERLGGYLTAVSDVDGDGFFDVIAGSLQASSFGRYQAGGFRLLSGGVRLGPLVSGTHALATFGYGVVSLGDRRWAVSEPGAKGGGRVSMVRVVDDSAPAELRTGPSGRVDRDANKATAPGRFAVRVDPSAPLCTVGLAVGAGDDPVDAFGGWTGSADGPVNWEFDVPPALSGLEFVVEAISSSPTGAAVERHRVRVRLP